MFWVAAWRKNRLAALQGYRTFQALLAVCCVHQLVSLALKYTFFCSFSECADTEQLERQVLRERFLGSISILIFTSSQMW